MKKIFYALAVLCAAAICATALAACGGDDKKNDEGGNKPPVTTPDDDDDDAGNTPGTTPGGDDEDDKEPETPTYTEVLSDGGLVFRTTNDTTIVQNSCNNSGVWDDDKGEFVYTNWDMMLGFSWSYTTILSNNSSVDSSDQNVIPDSAITYAPAEYGKASNVFSAIKVTIDTTKVKPGSAWLTMNFGSGNSSSSKGTLCVQVTVVDKLVLETMQNGVTIDFGDYAEEGDDILVRFFDSDYIRNSYIGDEPATSYVQVAGKVGADGKATFNFTYIKGHEYTIGICKGTEWYTSLAQGEPDRERVLILEDFDVIGSGSTETGSNQYKAGKLSFVTEGSTLELTVEGTFDELN